MLQRFGPALPEPALPRPPRARSGQPTQRSPLGAARSEKPARSSPLRAARSGRPTRAAAQGSSLAPSPPDPPPPASPLRAAPLGLPEASLTPARWPRARPFETARSRPPVRDRPFETARSGPPVRDRPLGVAGPEPARPSFVRSGPPGSGHLLGPSSPVDHERGGTRCPFCRRQPHDRPVVGAPRGVCFVGDQGVCVLAGAGTGHKLLDQRGAACAALPSAWGRAGVGGCVGFGGGGWHCGGGIGGGSGAL